jgi:hypothetical protein
MAATRTVFAALFLVALGATAHAAEGAPGGAAGARSLAPSASAGGLSASSPLDASGTFIRTGEKSASFAGALHGTFALQGASGPATALDGADVLCTATVHVDLSNQFQEGEGRCAFTAKNGDQAFADWECGGDQATGCKGHFEISVGTGSLKGIDGGGSVVLQGGVAPLAADSLGKRIDAAKAGTAQWTKLVLEFP